MAPVFDATLGGETSNSYCELAFATAYAANQPWGDTWAGLTQAQQEIALIGATKWMETLPLCRHALQCDTSACMDVAAQAVMVCQQRATSSQSKCGRLRLSWHMLSQSPDAITGPPSGVVLLAEPMSNETSWVTLSRSSLNTAAPTPVAITVVIQLLFQGIRGLRTCSDVGLEQPSGPAKFFSG